ncbi:uncharacterized protein LOC121854460 [Homarus americanus]|uniref:uncharacterized protein LOC121854460 n=1 Tax=Homarus americanus TaxID=6706 RepID=UPI001C44E9F0|nr:uncharacterized protein LOC121854460 [Homarus americanus]
MNFPCHDNQHLTLSSHLKTEFKQEPLQIKQEPLQIKQEPLQGGPVTMSLPSPGASPQTIYTSPAATMINGEWPVSQPPVAATAPAPLVPMLVCLNPQSPENSQYTTMRLNQAALASFLQASPGSSRTVLLRNANDASTTIPTVVTHITTTQLLQERDQLLQENKDLQHKVTQFQKLFKNKKKLTSVLRSLGIRAQ